MKVASVLADGIVEVVVVPPPVVLLPDTEAEIVKEFVTETLLPFTSPAIRVIVYFPVSANCEPSITVPHPRPVRALLLGLVPDSEVEDTIVVASAVVHSILTG